MSSTARPETVQSKAVPAFFTQEQASVNLVQDRVAFPHARRRIVRSGIQQIPLGSFLCAAAIYAIFCGEQTLKWYLQFFH